MESEKGITLIKLCFLVVLIWILFAMSYSAIKESFEATDLEKFVVNMELIQERVNLIRREYKLWEEYNPNEAENFHKYLETLGFVNAGDVTDVYSAEFTGIIDTLNSSDIEFWNKDIDSILANYYYFSPETLKSKLNITSFDNHIIINFYTGNVIAKDPASDMETGKFIYRQYDTEIGNDLIIVPISNEDSNIDVTILENYGLSQKIKISLLATGDDVSAPHINEIYYTLDTNDTRKRCTDLVDYTYNFEGKFATFTIDRSGTYSFIVEDTNSIQYKKVDFEVMLCNPPMLPEGFMGVYWDSEGIEFSISNTYDSRWYDYSKANFNMANAKDANGNYWVWVPRFIYEEKQDLINVDFVISTSKTSTKNVATNTYKECNAFEENESGFWIAKYQSNYDKKLLSIKPGKTLTILDKPDAINICKNYSEDVSLVSIKDLDALRMLAVSYNIQISNDLVHYAGGSPTETDIIKNVKYSSTGNISGVYDIETSETELTIDSDEYSGRFRPIIKIK